MTGLYSINLRIMDSPNLALLNEVTVFEGKHIIFFMLWICAIIGGSIIYFLNTHAGLGLRASGINPKVSKAYGVKVGSMILLGLALSNGIAALAGALFAQSQGFADISMGSGTVIIGLASVIIGETIFQTRKLSLAIISCLVGSIIYRLAIAFALNSTDLGLKASDLNLITALLVALTMILPKIKGNLRTKKI
jgi:putative ABC transport system permease protein